MKTVISNCRRAARFIVPAVGLSAMLGACSTSPSASETAGGTASAAPRAMAPLQAKSGSKVGGSVWFDTQGSAVRVTARVTGLVPGQEQGFHVHEIGDCSAPDATSAGGHFNPSGQPHGPQAAAHHGGDMPSLKADASGNAEATFMLEGVTVGTGADGVVGRAVIVHAQADDYKTQPTGNSGGRVACGVIGFVPGMQAAPSPKG